MQPPRKRSDDRAQLQVRLQHTVAQILSAARNEHEACAGILSTLCQNIDWPWGAFWIRRGDELRLLGCWHASDCAAHEFDQISRACVFKSGEGMPGRVWAQRNAVWVSDFTIDPEMPRRLAAARCDFRSAIGVPISGQEFYGALEFFTTVLLPEDPDLLKVLAAIGAQIGQFFERKRTEEALAESQSLFQGIFQGARDAILLSNDKGEIIEANAATTKLIARPRDNLIGAYIWDFVPIASDGHSRHQWLEILRTGTESEFTLRRSDGVIVDLEYRATPSVVPGLNLVVLRDMTGRKERERTARILAAAGAILGEGLDFHATLTRVARVAVPEFADWCVLDLLNEDGRIERAAIAHADHAVEEQVRDLTSRLPIDPQRQFGAPNVIRTGASELIDITPEVLQKTAGAEHYQLAAKLNLRTAVICPLKRQDRTFGALSFWRTTAREGFSNADFELAEELARRAGWALENARLYEAARLELQRREKAESDLKTLNAELERRIAERTAALRESHSQLESFCYSVSHDLRAPLRSMQGFSHALVEDHSAELNDEGRDFAKRIVSAAEHMDSLLADVLSYSRLTRQELKIEPVSLDAVLEDARAQFTTQIRQRAADVQIVSCGRSVLANKSVLELMIVNLLDNALKFVPAQRAPKISVHCERRGDAIRLWVRDNGIGIAREHQQKIFHIFERLHGVEAYPGTGIGLALVQKAAERLNGAVGLESAPGEGSSFWIELPSAISENHT